MEKLENFNLSDEITAVTPGIKDDVFIRGEVPMTKEEVRILSICKMHLHSNSVVFDVGSGTGSIAIEIARLSPQIKVFAIESNISAVELIQKNCSKFNCHNVRIIHGYAPKVFEKCTSDSEKMLDLNVIPTHAFIGGTKGKIQEILQALFLLNPKMRIVINAVTLESISQIQESIKMFNTADCEIIQLSVSKARLMGSYHLMQANNPVYLFAFNFKPIEK